MKLLVSVETVDEAQVACDAGCAILDIKNPREGSLGANFPWVLRDIKKRLPDMTCETSATIGDLPHKPGTAALAAYAVASMGIDYVKAGLQGSTTRAEALEMMRAVKRAVALANPKARAVAAGFADWRRFDGLSPADLVWAAREAQIGACLIDTYIKDGSTLFDHFSSSELEDFIGRCREAGILCALAGSIRAEHLPELARLDPDLIGVRGALCTDARDRRSVIDPARTREFIMLTAKATEQQARAV